MWCQHLPPITPSYDFFDLFCGVGNASKVWFLDGKDSKVQNHAYVCSTRNLENVGTQGKSMAIPLQSSTSS